MPCSFHGNLINCFYCRLIFQTSYCKHAGAKKGPSTIFPKKHNLNANVNHESVMLFSWNPTEGAVNI